MTSAVGSEVAVSGPFVACVRVGEEEVRGCLSDLSFDLLRACRPVRVPGVYPGQRHMPGRWFSTTAGCFLEYESLLECDWMLLMDFDREVEWI
ncbi:MAG: transposase, partial [Solirubrobacteraceae bacterium]